MKNSYRSPEIFMIVFDEENSILCISAGEDRTIEIMELED
jgi:hypothetical protein